MNAPFETTQPARTNKALWIAIGVLGVAVLGMGATLVRLQTQPLEPNTVMLPVVTETALAPLPTASTPPGTEAILTETNPEKSAPAHTDTSKATVKNSPPAKAIPAQNAPKNKTTQPPVFTAKPQPVLPQSPEPAVARAPQRPICGNCGVIESVTPIEREGTPNGVGVLAGGVLGAAVGNQVGDGNGKTLATILGAVGGAIGGNTVEKRMKKVIHYQVLVRMEDGSSRTITQANSATVGAQVVLNGDTLQSANP